MSTNRRDFFTTMAGAAAALTLNPVFSTPAEAQDGTVRINYNENPYGPGDKAVKAMRDSIANLASGRYYDDSSYEELSNLLAKHHGVKRENIQMGSGSTEILKICDDVFLRAKPKLVVAEPAYEAVIQYAVNSKADATKVKLTPDFRHDLAKMADAVTPDIGLVYICNPNNPTGTIVRKADVQRFMDRIPASVPVIVDEAYSHFATDPTFESAVRYVKEGRNVIVARTFSKIYGMAGLRVGYAIGKKELIDQIKPHTVDYTITSLAANAVMAAVNDTANVERVQRLIVGQRQIVIDEMKRLKFDTTDSQANFLMIDVRKPVTPVIEEFAKKKVLVGRLFPAMPNHMRVTIGTEDDTKKFLVAFREIFRA
jgi:histidinol-phosphate aminotransferase